jgi:CheY-like chemotaxis protein
MSTQIRARVLVVDDHEGVATRLGEMVEKAGFAASIAFSGTQGVSDFITAQSAGTPFAVVITDFSMADLDGLGVAEAVKTASPSTGVILLTAYVTDTDERPRHVDEVLGKPPTLDDLQSTLLKLIEQS